jgi:FKBP-type peptidyl-prolyl cis-trans isomerase FklB
MNLGTEVGFHLKGISGMRNVVLVVLALALAGCQSSGQKNVELKTQKDKVSYSIGLNIGSNMVRDSLDLDYDALVQGMKDAWLDTSKRMMKESEVQACMMTWQQEMQTKKMAHQQGVADKNKKDGEKFLEENKKEAGVVTLPSGLQYKVITEGKGPKPAATQTVVTNYSGTLIDGTEFDSSMKHGKPAEFPVNGVIKGWTEALQMMKVGSKWRLFIPPDLAYGDQGAGNVIPPGSTLIFEIELLQIK